MAMHCEKAIDVVHRLSSVLQSGLLPEFRSSRLYVIDIDSKHERSLSFTSLYPRGNIDMKIVANNMVEILGCIWWRTIHCGMFEAQWCEGKASPIHKSRIHTIILWSDDCRGETNCQPSIFRHESGVSVIAHLYVLRSLYSSRTRRITRHITGSLS